MSLFPLRGWRAYGFAVVMVLCVILLKYALFPLIGNNAPFLAFNLAIIISAWIGGGGAGIFATVLAIVFVPLLFEQGVSLEAILLRSVFIALEGCLISFMAYSLRRESANRQAAAEKARQVAEQSEKAAEERERMLQLITDSLPALIAHIGPDGRYRFNNQAYQDWFDRPLSEWRGRHLSEVLTPEAYERIRPSVERALAGEAVQFEGEFEYPVGRKQVTAAYIPNRLSTGEIDGFFALVHDVTAQRRAEAAKREGEQRLRFGYQKAPVGFCEIDLDGRFIYVNDEMCKITGYSPEELASKTIFDITHPEDHPADHEKLKVHLGQELAPTTLEKRYIRKDGSIVWVLATGSFIHSETGQPLYGIGVIQDIHERKLAEAELRASEERFEKTFRLAQTPMVITRRSDGRYIDVNDAYVEMCGYSREELLGRTTVELGLWPSDQTRSQAFGLDSQTNRSSFEFKHPTRGGASRDLLVTSVVVEIGGESCHIGTCLDVTEQRRAKADRERFFSLSGDLMIIVEINGPIRQFNQMWQQTLGYSEAELRDIKLLEIVHPDDREATTKTQRLLLSGQSLNGFVNRYRCKDGSYRWFSWNAVLSAEDGLCYGIGHDITELKRAETDLRQRESELRTLIENSDDIVIRFDRQGRHLYINPAIERHTGLKSPDFIGRTNAEMELSQSYVQAWDEALQSVVETGVKQTHVFAAETPQGKRHYEAYLIPEFDQQGHVETVLSVMRDISERVRLETALRHERDRLKAIMSSVPGVVWEAWGQPDLASQRINFVNDYVEPMLGYTKEEWLSSPNFWLSIVHPEDREQAAEVSRNIFFSGKGIDRFRWMTKSGKELWVEAHSTTIFDEERRPVGMRGVTLDITDRVLADQELRRREQHLRLAFDAALMGDWSWENTSNKVFLSDRAAKLFGVEPGEHTWDLLQSLIHTEDLYLVYKAFESAALQDGTFDCEFRLLQPDSGWRWCASRSFLKRDAQGQVSGLIGVIYDITSRKETELAIVRAKEEAEANLRRLDAVVNTMQDGLVLTQPNGEVLLFNPAALTLYGYQSIKDIRKPVAEICDDFEVWDAEGNALPMNDRPAMRSLRGEVKRGYQLKVRRKDTGAVFYGSYNISSIKNQNGEVELGVITLRDVSSERLAEAELRASEERFSKAFNLSPLPKAITRVSDGCYLDVNDAFLKMSGYRRDEVVGKTTLDLGIWKSNEDRRNNTKEIRGNRPLRNVDFPFRTKSGELRELRVATEVVTLNGEQCAISVMSDETERRGYERALRESEERLRLALDAAEIGTWDYDLQTNEAYQSSRVAMIFESKETRTSPESWAKVAHPSDRPRVEEEFRDLVQGRTNYKTEYRLLLSDGSERWVASRGALMRDEKGQPTRAIGICFDITGRKVLERQKEEVLLLEREARRQAEEASRLKDEFLLMLSHELRTPLNAILGWTTLLRSGRVAGDAAVRALETIDRNARVQVQIISDLLDVSRVISGKLVLDAAQVHLNEIVTAAADSVRLSAEAKGVTLSVDLGQSVGEAYGDATRLQQIIWNLLSNAVKFTPKGGRVAISLRPEGGWAVLRVSDTGQGIPPEFLPYIFDRFRQADASITRKFGGLGLGLSIVKHLVEMHGGTVVAESGGPDMGSTFTVRLPLGANKQKEGIEKTTPEAIAIEDSEFRSSGLLNEVKVLAVDDDQDTLELLRHILRAAGAEVRLAASAAAALDVLNEWRPDVILCDIAMPDVDGLKLIRTIRDRDAALRQHTPALALTAFARNEDRRTSLEAGFDDHLAKPADPDTLVTAVASLLELSRKSERT